MFLVGVALGNDEADRLTAELDVAYGESRFSDALDITTQLIAALKANPETDVVEIAIAYANRASMHDLLRMKVERRADLLEANRLLENSVNAFVRSAVMLQLAEVQEDADEGLELMRRALALRQTVLDPPHRALADMHEILAEALLMRGRIEEGLASSEHALQMHIDAGAKGENLGYAHHQRARALDLASRYDQALEHYDLALVELDAALGPDDPELSNVLANQSVLLSAMDDIAGALEASARALDIRVRAFGEDDFQVAALLVAIGGLHLDDDNPTAALPTYQRAVDIYEAALGPHNPRTEITGGHVGMALGRLGRVDEAAVLLERAVAAMASSPGNDLEGVAFYVRQLGFQYQKLGRIQQAEALYRRGLALIEEATGPDSPHTARYQRDLGMVLANQGQLTAARNLLESSLRIRRRTLGDDHSETAEAIYELGQVAERLGDLEVAQDRYAEAVAVYEAAGRGDKLSVVGALQALGMMRVGDGDRGGLEDLQRGIDLLTETLGKSNERTVANRMQYAEALSDLGDNEEALTRLDTELGHLVDTLGPDHRWVIGWRLERERVRLQLGRKGALQAYDEALAAYLEQAGNDPYEELSAREALAWGLSKADQPERARVMQAEILVGYEAEMVSRVEAAGDRDALEAGAAMRGALDRYLELFSDPGDEAEAYTAMLRWKGAVTRLLSARRGALGVENRQRLRAIDAEVAGLLFDPREPEVRDQALKRLRTERESIERSVAVTPQATGSMSPTHVCATLPPDSLFVDVLRHTPEASDARYVAFTTSDGCGIRRLDLGPADAIDTAIREWLDVLSAAAPAQRIDQRGARVRELLWEPIAAVLGSRQHLIVSPDSQVAAVPWAAIPLDGGYVVEGHEVATVPQAADLQGRPSTGRGALLVGGVEFGEANGSCRDWSPLPGTAREVANLATHWRPRRDPLRTLGGVDASESTVLAALGGHRVVHLATHGFFEGHCGEAEAGGEASRHALHLSGLVFAGVNERDSDPYTDGIVTAADLAHVDLNGTELVVLSACGSGRGATRSGEGVLGMQGALRSAGAHTVVMSLWPIPDEETADLMTAFYREVLRRRTSPPQALRAAQLGVLDANRRAGDAAPGDWAAFVSSGL